MEEGYKYITRFYFVLFLFAAVGAAAGALYYVNKCATGDYIKDYLDSFAVSIKGGVNGGSVALRSVKKTLVIVGIFAICSFFRAGIIPIAAIAARQGFVCGFANAVFIGTYGGKGVLISAARLPELTLLFAAMLISGAAACAAAFLKPEKNKKLLKNFLFFFIFSVSTFCASSLVEGFLTTTFMKLIL